MRLYRCSLNKDNRERSIVDMDIFIGDLPGKNYKYEISNMFMHVDKNSQVKIIAPVVKHTNKGFFCVVNIRDEKTAKKFIKKFNKKSPFGHRLLIREFIHRAYGNERREIDWRKRKWKGIEERKGDRRIFSPVLQ